MGDMDSAALRVLLAAGALAVFLSPAFGQGGPGPATAAGTPLEPQGFRQRPNLPPIVDGGTPAASAQVSRIDPDIIDPGTAVGLRSRRILAPTPSAPTVLARPRPGWIVDGGTPVSSLILDPPAIIDPGTAVAIRAPSTTAGSPATSSPQLAGAGGSGVQVIITVPGEGTPVSPAGVQQAAALAAPVSGYRAIRPAAAAPAQSLVPPFGYKDLDSGLRDCDIPFEELRTRSPFCKAGQYADGRRCERYAPSQFPEIVRLTIFDASRSTSTSCTGTMIAEDWVLTAAHCFIGSNSTAEESGEKDKDLVWSAEASGRVLVESMNAKLLLPDQHARVADRVVVYSRYGGELSAPQFTDDLAVVRISAPFPSHAVEPAVLAASNDFSEMVTIAGYGYSNAGPGSLGVFNLTWPVPVVRVAGALSFSPRDGGVIRSGFCQGDSGGPVLAGRYRGCKRSDVEPEMRPRLVQGTISFNRLAPLVATGNPIQDSAQRCRGASEMVMQDITAPARRSWICRATQRAAGGC